MKYKKAKITEKRKKVRVTENRVTQFNYWYRTGKLDDKTKEWSRRNALH